MKIFVKNLTGNTVTIYVDASDKVEYLKAKIKDEEDIPTDKQMLIFKGQQLCDGCVLSEYGIVQESEIHLILIEHKGKILHFNLFHV